MRNDTLNWATKFLRHALFAFGVGFVVVYVIVALLRMGYPFELEWIEGSCVDHVIHILDGKSDQIHGRFGNPAHGVDITQRIGCSNLSEPVWIIHNGCEEIYGLNDGKIIRHLIDAGIISTLQPDDEILIRWEF